MQTGHEVETGNANELSFVDTISEVLKLVYSECHVTFVQTTCMEGGGGIFNGYTYI